MWHHDSSWMQFCVYAVLKPEKGPVCSALSRPVLCAVCSGEETVMWTDRLDDFISRHFISLCLHLRQPPEAESKSLIKRFPHWFHSIKPAPTVCFVVDNRPTCPVVALGSAGLPGAALPLSSSISPARRRCCCCCCFTALSVARLSTFYSVQAGWRFTSVVLWFLGLWLKAKKKYSRRLPRRHQRWR